MKGLSLAILICPFSWGFEIAYVDLNAAFLLHPKMKEFHFPIFQFRKPPKPAPGQSLDDYRQKRKQALLEQSRRIQTFENSKESSLQELNRKLHQLRAGRGLAYEEEMKAVADSWRAEQEEEQSSMKTQSDRYYFDERGTRTNFARIWQEIREALKELQERHLILAFLPVHENSKYIQRKVESFRLDQQPAASFRSPWAPFLKASEKVDPVELELRMEPYLSQQETVKSLFAPYFPSWEMPVGGVDRTEELIVELHKNHSTPPGKRDQVLSVYRFWKNDFVGRELAIFRESAPVFEKSRIPAPPEEF